MKEGTNKNCRGEMDQQYEKKFAKEVPNEVKRVGMRSLRIIHPCS
jgi:hypothetical protein